MFMLFVVLYILWQLDFTKATSWDWQKVMRETRCSCVHWWSIKLHQFLLCCVSAAVFLYAFPPLKIFSGNWTPCCFYLFFKSCLVAFISRDSKWVVLFPTLHTERKGVEKLCGSRHLAFTMYTQAFCESAERGEVAKAIRAVIKELSPFQHVVLASSISSVCRHIWSWLLDSLFLIRAVIWTKYIYALFCPFYMNENRLNIIII